MVDPPALKPKLVGSIVDGWTPLTDWKEKAAWDFESTT